MSLEVQKQKTRVNKGESQGVNSRTHRGWGRGCTKEGPCLAIFGDISELLTLFSLLLRHQTGKAVDSASCSAGQGLDLEGPLHMPERAREIFPQTGQACS